MTAKGKEEKGGVSSAVDKVSTRVLATELILVCGYAQVSACVCVPVVIKDAVSMSSC